MMGEYVTLIGTEEVRSAAYTMKSAASDMSQVALNMDGSFQQFLVRFELLVERLEALSPTEEG
jgi:hypothetical protein